MNEAIKIQELEKECASLKSEMEQVKAERDALLKDINDLLRSKCGSVCDLCKYDKDADTPCSGSMVWCSENACWRGKK